MASFDRFVRLAAWIFLVAGISTIASAESPAIVHFVSTPRYLVTFGAPAATSVPRSFLGVSMEYSDLPLYTDAGTGTPSRALVNLLSGLDPADNGAALIRIGGGSSDHVAWVGVTDRGVTYQLTPSWTETLRNLLTGTGAKTIVSVNLGANDPDAAATMANQLFARLGTRLAAVEVGNEPDNFPGRPMGDGTLIRPSTYDISAYAGELAHYSAALRAAQPTLPLAAPSFGSWKWLDEWLKAKTFAALNAAGGATQKLITWHRYPLVSCDKEPGQPGYPKVDTLLANSTERYLLNGFSRVVAHAQSVGKQVRVTELNTVGCGGAPGVSDAFASSLWMVRTLFDLAHVGVAGVNVHMLPSASYSPITYRLGSNGSQLSAGATYYGMRLFALATADNAHLLSVNSNLPLGMNAWATMDTTGREHVVLLNLNTSSTSVNVAAAGAAATSELLSAPSPTSTSGITLAGQTYGTDGLPAGTPTISHLTTAYGRYVVPVPANSAVLVTVNPLPVSGVGGDVGTLSGRG